jgi:hypothetical protein
VDRLYLMKLFVADLMIGFLYTLSSLILYPSLL